MGMVMGAAAGESGAGLAGTLGLPSVVRADMPKVPPQNAPVMVAQANEAQGGGATAIRTIGVCSPATNNINYAGENALSPLEVAGLYLQQFENRTVTGAAATTMILQQLKHGTLRLVTQADIGTLLPSGGDPVNPADGLYIYLPEQGYVGKDKVLERK